MSRLTLIAFACIFLAVVIVAPIFVLIRPVQIVYHTYQLNRHDFGNEDVHERHRQHCDSLVSLGYFFHKTYEMENLPDSPGVHAALWQRVLDEFPDSGYATLTLPGNVLEVWDTVDRESQWDGFAEKYNVNDFMEHYSDNSE
jgi:hypothetical protein